VIVFGRCVGAKANVLHCVGFVRGYAALLILLKRWHFSDRLLSIVSYFSGWWYVFMPIMDYVTAHSR
jgi:hypothetical protein